MLLELVTTVLDVLGLALLVAAAWLVYAPAGVAVAGVAVLVLSWRLAAAHRPAADEVSG